MSRISALARALTSWYIAVPVLAVAGTANAIWRYDSPNLAGALPEAFLRVTPGVRPAGEDAGDQKRVATPAKALAGGAHYLVIGRPITEAADPAAALAGIEAELSAAI